MAVEIEDLCLLIRSRHPIVTIETVEERRTLERVTRAASSLSLPCYVWDLVEGLRPVPPGPETVPETYQPPQVLAAIITRDWPGVFVLQDFCTHLKDATLQRMLRNFSGAAQARHQTLVLLDQTTDLPETLARLAVPFEVALPDEAELEQIVRETFTEQARYCKIRCELTRSQLQQVIQMLRGLTATEAKLAVTRCIIDDDCLDAHDIGRLLLVKRDRLREGGLLEYIDPDIDLDALGGLGGLKKWLALRANALSPEAREFGLPPPKGILLLGVQGCGKSAACKAVGAAWKMPLLRMDPGRLYDKYVGESEANLRKAIKQAEAMAPVILWIDEIEKAFASAAAESTDGGLSKRMFGTLLNWLQDHTAPIFCVATANDITALPPELVRKGRFDEIFFVDLPGPAARAQIITIHLKKRKRRPEQFDLAALVEASEGFSGAEIEQAAVSALYAAFGAKREVNAEDVLNELRSARPLSVTLAERVAALREWAAERCVPAD
jgi:AAA+ superfamily predicted ATPase